MADPFVIYTMGESGLFASALNGVAMLFNDTSLYHGDGVGNMGLGAFFGMMLLFTVWLYNAAFKQQMDMRALLAPLVVYMILTVPKATVAIEDVYSGNVKTVANVPLGLALPASVASGISVVFTEIIEKAYQVVADYPNGYMPKISEDGYVTPLKLINALRDSSSIVPSQSLLQTTKNIYQSCIAANPNFNVEDYRKHENPVKYFTDAAKTSTSTVVYVTLAATGISNDNIMTCSDAASEVQKAMTAYVDGINNSTGGATQVNKIIGDVTLYNLRNAMLRQMTANGESAGFNPKPSAGGSNYTINDIVNYVSLMGNTSQDNARNFMMATIFNPMLETASYCYDKSDGMSGMSKCSAWISSRSQWEEKNAAAGTGFLQVMRDGQNVLIMLSFLFFPIIVLFIMIQGTSSFKLLGNYMAFTVAAYLWLPMAAIINFYIQNTLADEWIKVANATGIHTLNLITGPQFYAAVSQKLALANALLASVPVLCMMLFSGMMMGMNQIYARMNSADAGNYDAKVNTPDISKSAPMASSSSTITLNGQNVAMMNGVPQASLSSSNTQKTSAEYSQTLSNKGSEIESSLSTLANKLGVDISTSRNNSSGVGNSQTYAEGGSININSTVKKGTNSSDEFKETDSATLGNQVAEQTVRSSGGNVGASVQGGVNGTGNIGNQSQPASRGANGEEKPKKVTGAAGLSGEAKVGGGVNGAMSKINSDGKSFNRQDAAALSNLTASFSNVDSGTSNGLSKSHTAADYSQQLNEIVKKATETKGADFVQQHSSDINRTREQIESYKQSQQQSMEFSSSISADPGQVQGMIGQNPQAFANFKSEIAALNDPKIEQDKNRIANSVATQLPNGEAKDNFALVLAAQQSDNPLARQAYMRYSNPQGEAKYTEMSGNLNNMEIERLRSNPDQVAENAANQIQAAQARTELTPNANALPSRVNGPNAAPMQAPKQVNPTLISAAPQDYRQMAADANDDVQQGAERLLSAKPKN